MLLSLLSVTNNTIRKSSTITIASGRKGTIGNPWRGLNSIIATTLGSLIQLQLHF